MCGLAGYISKDNALLTREQKIVRGRILNGMLVAMETRGDHSTGVCGVVNGKAKIVKTIARRGQKINLGDKVFAQVVWPIEGTYNDLNKSSVVLKITLDDFCAFLTGDIDWEVEDGLVSLGGLEKCLVLKVAHDGSATALSGSFMSAISPKLAVIAVGEKNSFGHPTKEVLEELGKKESGYLKNSFRAILIFYQAASGKIHAMLQPTSPLDIRYKEYHNPGRLSL